MNLLTGFSFELPTRIEYGIGAVQKLAEDVEALAENSFRNGSNGSNPRPMTRDDYLRVIKGMMA